MEPTAQKVIQNTLPKEASDYLWSADAFETYEQLAERLGIDDAFVPKISGLVFSLVEQDVDPDGFLKGLEAIGIQSTLIEGLVSGILTEILVKIQSHLPFNLQELAASWEVELSAGEVEKKVEEKEEKEEETLESYVKNYVASVPDITQARIARRLETILIEYLSGHTQRNQTKERLTHSVKIDGLGLTENGAEILLSTIDADEQMQAFRVPQRLVVAELAQAEPVVPAEKVAPKPVETPKESPAPLQAQGVKEVSPEVFLEEDKKEVEQIAKEQSHVVQTSELVTPEAIVAKICQKEPFKFDDPLLEGRCKKIVESRVRGVRDARGAMVTLERAVDKGGLGVKGRRLADIMEALEADVQAYERSHEGKMAVRKQEHVQKRIDQREQKVEQAKKQQQHLAKRYADLTGKAPAVGVAPAAPPVSRTSAAVSAHHEMREREGKIDAGRVKAAIESAKAPVPKPQGTPSMKEISFEKRLSGPVDELRTLDLTDFRRLSSDPNQAATKLKDKVDLIEDQQGHAEKVAAIDAWRTSPLHKMYVDLTREAVLAGVPVTQVLEQHRAAGEETLSDEELAAIMHVNAELRF